MKCTRNIVQFDGKNVQRSRWNFLMDIWCCDCSQSSKANNVRPHAEIICSVFVGHLTASGNVLHYRMVRFSQTKSTFFLRAIGSNMGGVWVGCARERAVEHEFYILLSTRLKCKMHIFMWACCSSRCIVSVPLHIPYLALARLAHHFLAIKWETHTKVFG